MKSRKRRVRRAVLLLVPILFLGLLSGASASHPVKPPAEGAKEPVAARQLPPAMLFLPVALPDVGHADLFGTAIASAMAFRYARHRRLILHK